MKLQLIEHNITLIDFEDIHKTYDHNLINKLHDLQLLNSDFKKNKDIRKLLYHFTIKGVIDYINSTVTNTKLVLYFNNTQFYESPIIEYINEHDYLDILTKLLIKIRNLLPIKITITHKSLTYFKHLLDINDGRAKSTVTKLYSTINKFNIEKFTFEKIKKFAKNNDLTFLSNKYFEDIKTKQVVFR